MCGIVGWIDFTRDLRGEAATIEAMTETLRRRGPDGAGNWLGQHAAIGHRRLAVIDLAGGVQPMVAPSPGTGEPVVLAYNGEVYNFRELRGQLRGLGHAFTTRSDVEVVLRAYLEWGAGLVDRLVGIYAFAVWDAARCELLLVRDRLGVKPLYYHPYPDGLLFASEPKALLAHGRLRPRIVEASLPMLFNSRLAPAGTTPLDGLHELRPGHLLRLNPQAMTDTGYWRLEGRDHTDDLSTTVGVVRAQLEEIVSQQLFADVPLCGLLSGGLDSSTLVALANRDRQSRGDDPLRTFAVDFTDRASDYVSTQLRPERDAPYARLAADYLGTRHTEVLLDADALTSALPAVRAARDLPSLGQFDASMYWLFATIREHATVLISGEGADELFGGYPWYHDQDLLRRDSFPWLSSGPQPWDFLSTEARARIRPDEQIGDLYSAQLAAVPRVPGESSVDARRREALYLGLQGPFALVLDRKDRMSMAVGLEARVPFCDHRLFEYVWSVPWSMKTADGREKSLLRAAAADLLPELIRQRRKSAFPKSSSPEYAASVFRDTSALLADRRSPLCELLDHTRIKELMDSGGSTADRTNAVNLLVPIVEVAAWMADYDVSLS